MSGRGRFVWKVDAVAEVHSMLEMLVLLEMPLHKSVTEAKLSSKHEYRTLQLVLHPNKLKVKKWNFMWPERTRIEKVMWLYGVRTQHISR